ncbi:MAG: tetratricopeptide repeat protein [Yoonia sp.]|nr:tetratricopeptide repeat protein [Yoonia sp.]
MSDTDSFINEVTDEVRRDALYGYLRRYGWIAVLVVVGVVGGAAYNEYNKAQTQSAAQAVGDQMLDALSADAPEDRATALVAIDAAGPSAAVAALLTAATQQEAGQIEAAAQTLGGLAINADVPEIYRDLAALKAAMLPSEDTAARLSSLETLAQPGASFALLAREQIGLMQVEAGDTDAAIATMRLISEDAGVTRGLRERAQTLIVALGGDITAPALAE